MLNGRLNCLLFRDLNEGSLLALLATLQFAGHLVRLQGGDDVCPGHGGCCHCSRGEDQEAGGHEAALHAAAAAAAAAAAVCWRGRCPGGTVVTTGTGVCRTRSGTLVLCRH